MAAQNQRLREEIERVLAHIDRVMDRSDRLSEADTKAAFIDPILNALGWDLRDVFSVSREYRHKPQDNPVDYALFVVRSPVLFVEAKSLSRKLSDYKWITQTIAYANAAGVQWCALTNGDEYRIYNAFAKVEADDKLFRNFKLSDRAQREFAIDTLLLLSSNTLAEKRIDVLWKEQFVDTKVRDTVKRLFREQDEVLIRLIARKASELRPSDVRDSLRRSDFELKHLQTLSNALKSLSVAQPNKNAAELPSPTEESRVSLSDLIAARIISTPLEIEVTFKDQRLTAKVDEKGIIHFAGRTYDSPSRAGAMARKIVSGQPPDGRPYWSTNGWTFWRYRDASTGKLEPINKLKEQFKKSQNLGNQRLS